MGESRLGGGRRYGGERCAIKRFWPASTQPKTSFDKFPLDKRGIFIDYLFMETSSLDATPPADTSPIGITPHPEEPTKVLEMSKTELSVMASLEGDLCDGMTTYKNLVSVYHPFKLCSYLLGAPSQAERRHRLHVLAEAFAVAFEFDDELPFRLRASHDLDLASIELFEALDMTGEIPPALTSAMVTP